MEIPPKEGKHILNCAQQVGPKVSQWLLDYDGIPKACKAIRKKKSDKVQRSVADFYGFFLPPQVLPSTTSYYKDCTKYFPVLLRTAKLAQSTSQYYFVLQSLHKVLPSTTSYYKACTKYFPVLLRTTKLAQSISQYHFVLQSLHKVLPSTTLHYKACTKYFPVLLRTAKLAQSTSQYYFVLQSLHKDLQNRDFTSVF